LCHYKKLDEQKVLHQSLDRSLNEDVVIKVGPFGPYIKYKNSINIPLPKALKTKWETITLEECLPVIEKNKDRKPKGKAKAEDKSAAKATTKPKVVRKPKAADVKTSAEPVIESVKQIVDNVSNDEKPKRKIIKKKKNDE
jgi:topoisomerase IA-like protein